ncbi:hypothetical protein NEHOM01_1316 [Nematocida homosporus]|uniref:uncharacterized protein n=1 Tax=Nematocida homosporus TaxID=1912981 RepID=UPI00221EF514|nr:uncharacterized protein NEHOM01_1316 [Nematocida homosporus]KAI5186151.1 hypothetical protein NEHOM01_1316 [Nematocida homosporus]
MKQVQNRDTQMLLEYLVVNKRLPEDKTQYRKRQLVRDQGRSKRARYLKEVAIGYHKLMSNSPIYTNLVPASNLGFFDQEWLTKVQEMEKKTRGHTERFRWDMLWEMLPLCIRDYLGHESLIDVRVKEIIKFFVVRNDHIKHEVESRYGLPKRDLGQYLFFGDLVDDLQQQVEQLHFALGNESLRLLIFRKELLATMKSSLWYKLDKCGQLCLHYYDLDKWGHNLEFVEDGILENFTFESIVSSIVWPKLDIQLELLETGQVLGATKVVRATVDANIQKSLISRGLVNDLMLRAGIEPKGYFFPPHDMKTWSRIVCGNQPHIKTLPQYPLECNIVETSEEILILSEQWFHEGYNIRIQQDLLHSQTVDASNEPHLESDDQLCQVHNQPSDSDINHDQMALRVLTQLRNQIKAQHQADIIHKFTPNPVFSHTALELTTINNARNIVGEPASFTDKSLAAAKTILTQLIKKGIIKQAPSQTGFSTAYLINNEILIDYWETNRGIYDKAPMLPDQLQRLANIPPSSYFSQICLCPGHYQINLDKKSAPLTAFSFDSKTIYHWQKVPFGIKNFATEFYHQTEQLFQQNPIPQVVHIMNTFIVFSNTWQENAVQVSKLLKFLKAKHLKIDPLATKLLIPQIECVGHILSQQNHSPNHKRASIFSTIYRQSAFSFHTPLIHLIRHIQEFYIPDLYKRSDLADLDEKILDLHHNPQHYISKKHDLYLKSALHTIIIDILQNKFQTNRPFQLYTDASNVGIGAALIQDKKIIGVFAKPLSHKEKLFNIQEREFLAIVQSVKYFKDIIALSPTYVFTDNLANTVSSNTKLDRIKQWRLHLQAFHLEISYIKGKENLLADFLSRIH